MSFVDIVRQVSDEQLMQRLQQVTDDDVVATLHREYLDMDDFLVLVSPTARHHLEEMAQLAHQRTIQQFGYTVQLFTPMYIANYCDNGCVYCGYSHHSRIVREKLSLEDILKEAHIIKQSGLEQVLVLTGESSTYSPPSYIKSAVKALVDIFSAVSIEVYSLSLEDYQDLVAIGADGMTMFQETYNPVLYKQLHPFGPKSVYDVRIDTPELACRAGFRNVNIGALMGLDQWQVEANKTALHAEYLLHKYPDVEISVSVPRIRPCAVGYSPKHPVDDVSLVQYILALRLVFPRIGITLSSRENQTMRDHLVGLGITKVSAGVSTSVGGHSKEDDSDQFVISDTRSVAEMETMLRTQGYQPVYKDWQVF